MGNHEHPCPHCHEDMRRGHEAEDCPQHPRRLKSPDNELTKEASARTRRDQIAEDRHPRMTGAIPHGRANEDQDLSDFVDPMGSPVRLKPIPDADPPKTANTRQEGGSHYGLSAFQHWDMVVLFDLDYFQGQITKYVLRWRKKNGLEDLKKAKHFLDKYIEEIEAERIVL